VADTPDDVVMPCGCFIHCDEATKEMRVSPCRPDCRILALALQEATEQGKPVEYRRGT